MKVSPKSQRHGGHSMSLVALVLNMAAALGCAISLGLLFWQGRENSIQGLAMIVVAAAATAWFSYRLKSRGAFHRQYRGRSFGVFLGGLVALYLLMLGALYLLQDKLLFMPVLGRFSDCAEAKAAGYRFIDESVNGRRLRMLVHENGAANSWTIVFHGNAESSCDSFINYGQELERLPTNVALVEYPGYQDDLITPSQENLTANAILAFDWIQAHGKGALPVFTFGRSLGTGVATYVAAMRPAKGLILVSPYTSIADAGQSQYPFVPVSWLIRNKFPAADWAAKVTAPTFIVHGDADRVIPVALGRQISKQFKALELFIEVPGAGHNDVMHRDAASLWGRIGSFLAKHSR